MGHEHAHHAHAHGRPLAIALALVLVMLLVELAGAWMSGSLALLSDAAHMATDAAALSISLAASRLSERSADLRRSFGYHRFEVLAAAANATLLLLAAAYIGYEAFSRLHLPARVDTGLMLVVAVLGLAVNLFSIRLLASGQKQNLNLRGAYLEVWSDMLGSVAVIVGAAGIWLTGWQWIDSAVAVGIALWVVPRSWELLRRSINVLLEGVPEGVQLAELDKALRECPGIQSVHDLHVWSIGSGSISLSVHAVLTPTTSASDALLGRIRAMLAQRFDIHHTTVQLENQPCEQARSQHSFGP